MAEKRKDLTPAIEKMIEPFLSGSNETRNNLLCTDRNSFLKVCECVSDSVQRMGNALHFLEGLLEGDYRVTFHTTEDPEMQIGMTIIRPDGREFGFKSEAAVGCLIAAHESLERAIFEYAVKGKEVN